MPFVMLAEASSTFNASSALELVKTVMTWIFDVIKSEPILSAAFVCGVLVPVGFSIVRGIKHTSK